MNIKYHEKNNQVGKIDGSNMRLDSQLKIFIWSDLLIDYVDFVFF